MTTTPETQHHHPWDDELDSGYGWTDQIVSQWEGKSVFVTRNIDGPELDIEHMRIVFPDGSRLYLAMDCTVPIERKLANGDVRHPFEIAKRSDASEVFGHWVKALYDAASVRELDTDL